MAAAASDRRPFRVTKRSYPDGKTIFYAQFATSTGGWTKRKSTGCQTRGAAEKWCIARLQSGMAASMAHGDMTLAEWCAGFWGPGGRYDRERRARGYTLSRTYLHNGKRNLDNFILPVFGKRRLYELTPAELDAFFLNLYHDSGKSGATVNNIMKSLRAPLREAERLGLIAHSPMRAVQQVANGSRERGALTQDELDALFAPDCLSLVWKDDRVAMLTAMLCAGCGLRHGEAVAVRLMDIENGVLRVTRQWDRNAAEFKAPKWKSMREVPVPPRVAEELEAYYSDEGMERDAVVAAGRVPTRPRDEDTTNTALRAALVEIGIPEEQQRRTARFLDVHALRHTYVTRLRAGGVPDWQVQAAAGHKSLRMTDAYTHGTGRDFDAVAAASIIPFTKSGAA